MLLFVIFIFKKEKLGLLRKTVFFIFILSCLSIGYGVSGAVTINSKVDDAVFIDEDDPEYIYGRDKLVIETTSKYGNKDILLLFKKPNYKANLLEKLTLKLFVERTYRKN